jgi:hypothetical protein
MPPATCILLTQGNNRIRKVDTNGIITTVAGNGGARLFRRRRRGHQCQLVLSLGVAFDASGNLYIADRLQQSHPQGGHQRHHHHRGGQWQSGYSGDGGAATNASLDYPPPAWPSMPSATCILLTPTTTASARWTPTASSPPWRAMAVGTAIPATAARPPTPAFIIPVAWPSMPPATCILLTRRNNRIRKVCFMPGIPPSRSPNVSATNAGNYTVVITSPYGSVTSALPP